MKKSIMRITVGFAVIAALVCAGCTYNGDGNWWEGKKDPSDPVPDNSNDSTTDPCYYGATGKCCTYYPDYPGCYDSPPDNPCYYGATSECCAYNPSYSGCYVQPPYDPCDYGATAECCEVDTDYSGCPRVPGVPTQTKTTFTDDRDGNIYYQVQIGNQVWMAQNLNYAGEWGNIGTCYDYEPDSCAKYGRLYTWEVAKSACPKGWKLPTDDDWTILVNHVGGDETAGKKLKATSGWSYEGVYGNGTDQYEFSALPGGFGDEGSFYDAGNSGYWWSVTEGTSFAWFRRVNCNIENVYRNTIYKNDQISVRCVQNK